MFEKNKLVLEVGCHLTDEGGEIILGFLTDDPLADAIPCIKVDWQYFLSLEGYDYSMALGVLYHSKVFVDRLSNSFGVCLGGKQERFYTEEAQEIFFFAEVYAWQYLQARLAAKLYIRPSFIYEVKRVVQRHANSNRSTASSDAIRPSKEGSYAIGGEGHPGNRWSGPGPGG